MITLVPTLLAAPLFALLLFPIIWSATGRALGCYIRRASHARRSGLLETVKREQQLWENRRRQDQGKPSHAEDEDEDWEKVDGDKTGVAKNGGTAVEGDADAEWSGVIGFFHPFCNAGGGGERVLWAAIRATQQRYPSAICVVYTGDHDVSKDSMLDKVSTRFNIHLYPPMIHFLYLSTRHYVLASTYPHFTLLGQSLGSLVLALDAFSLLVPDVFVDTMGFAFALGLCKFLFPTLPTGAYVHYPTISTDMLSSLSAPASSGRGVNAGAGAGLRGKAKKMYWHLFAQLYSRFGSNVDVVMTNSSWTQSHIRQLWGPVRKRRGKSDVSVVFPPCPVEEMQREIEAPMPGGRRRDPFILCIAQFRPEKNHTLVIEAFAKLMAGQPYADKTGRGRPRLVLVGSVRDSDDATRVYNLRLLTRELQVKDDVEFVCDAPYPHVLSWLRRSSVGVNGMWNEHFGIGVVEYQAASLISVVNDSGGPKLDIVVDIDGKATGFHASTTDEYAAAFAAALELSPQDDLAMRLRARKSAKRFTEEAFAEKWARKLEKAVALERVKIP